MAYIIGDDPSHGIVAAPRPASTPKPPYWRTLPVGPNYRYRTSPQIPDEEDALGRKVYIGHVYDGLVSNLPEVQKVIAESGLSCHPRRHPAGDQRHRPGGMAEGAGGQR